MNSSAACVSKTLHNNPRNGMMRNLFSNCIALLVILVVGGHAGAPAPTTSAANIRSVAAKAPLEGIPFAFPPPVDAKEAMRLAVYAYDRDLPLNPQLKPLNENDDYRRFHLVYDSVHEQAVTAIVAIPKR